MATPNKRRAASPRERADKPTHHKQYSRTFAPPTPATPAGGGIELTRVLCLARCLLEEADKYAYLTEGDHSAEMDAKALELQRSIREFMPKLDACITVLDGGGSCHEACPAVKGGAA